MCSVACAGLNHSFWDMFTQLHKSARLRKRAWWLQVIESFLLAQDMRDFCAMSIHTFKVVILLFQRWCSHLLGDWLVDTDVRAVPHLEFCY